MWPVNGKPVQSGWLDLKPETILYDFDGPRIFTCKDVPGNLYLAYQCGKGPGRMRFLVVPFHQYLEWKLTTGQIDLREALASVRAWIFDLDYRWQVSDAWQVDTDNLPGNAIPKPGVMLWAHLQPVMSPVMSRSASSGTSITIHNVQQQLELVAS